MPVVLPQQITIIASGKCKAYYLNKGYEMINNKIIVNVEDLINGSHKKVACICNKCEKEFQRPFFRISDINITYCKRCSNVLAQETWKKNFGYDNPSKCEAINKKRKATNLEKYGEEYPLKSKEVREKIKNTVMERYGEEYITSCDWVKEKIANTNIEKYGVKSTLSLENVQEKIKQTNLERYGTENPIVSDIVQEKIRESKAHLYEKNVKTSKGQNHIAELLNGDVNTKIRGYFPDIVINDLIVEYDGSGHWMTITAFHTYTQEEFETKEKAREQIFLEENYKIIRIICKNDKLPSDETILSTIDEIKNIFNKENKRIARWNTQDNTIIYE
jgi:very-short-patch-repair endonuclease